MVAIEKENEQLKNILPKNYARPELDKMRLGSVIDEFTNLQLKGKDGQDLLDRAYEYCLTMFAEEEGKHSGMFVQSAKFIDVHSGNRGNKSIYGQDSNPTTFMKCIK